MESIKISIITVCLNNKAGLKKTIESVIGQTYTNKEYIIIDGQSTDGSVDLIKSYDTQIDYWISEKDQGIYDAMNKGIDKATGEYLLFLNSGDSLHNANILFDIFSVQQTKDIIYGNIELIFKDGEGTIFSPTKKINALSFAMCPIKHQSSFIKKSVFQKYGKYDTSYKIAGDFEGWLRFIYYYNTTYQYIDKCISSFQYYDGLSTLEFFKKLLLKENRAIRKKYFSYHLRIICNLIEFVEGIIKHFPRLYNFIRKLYVK